MKTRVSLSRVDYPMSDNTLVFLSKFSHALLHTVSNTILDAVVINLKLAKISIKVMNGVIEQIVEPLIGIEVRILKKVMRINTEFVKFNVKLATTTTSTACTFVLDLVSLIFTTEMCNKFIIPKERFMQISFKPMGFGIPVKDMNVSNLLIESEYNDHEKIIQQAYIYGNHNKNFNNVNKNTYVEDSEESTDEEPQITFMESVRNDCKRLYNQIARSMPNNEPQLYVVPHYLCDGKAIKPTATTFQPTNDQEQQGFGDEIEKINPPPLLEKQLLPNKDLEEVIPEKFDKDEDMSYSRLYFLDPRDNKMRSILLEEKERFNKHLEGAEYFDTEFFDAMQWKKMNKLPNRIKDLPEKEITLEEDEKKDLPVVKIEDHHGEKEYWENLPKKEFEITEPTIHSDKLKNLLNLEKIGKEILKDSVVNMNPNVSDLSIVNFKKISITKWDHPYLHTIISIAENLLQYNSWVVTLSRLTPDLNQLKDKDTYVTTEYFVHIPTIEAIAIQVSSTLSNLYNHFHTYRVDKKLTICERNYYFGQSSLTFVLSMMINHKEYQFNSHNMMVIARSAIYQFMKSSNLTLPYMDILNTMDNNVIKEDIDNCFWYPTWYYHPLSALRCRIKNWYVNQLHFQVSSVGQLIPENI